MTAVTTCPSCGRLAVSCPTPCESKATARRIAACLFACEGLPTEALESGAVRQALTAAREGLEAGDTRREVEADTRLVAALDALGMAPQAPEDWLGRKEKP